MSRLPRALFVGDISLDTTLSMDQLPQPDEKRLVQILSETPGGVVSNAALACRLAGAEVSLAVQTGDDLFADALVAPLSAAGIDILRARRAGRTCRAIVLLEPHGEKRLLLEPGVSLYPSVEQLDRIELGPIAWVHTAIYGEAAFTLIDRCRALGIPWSIDLEPATFADGLETLHSVLNGAEAVFCNQRALAEIGEGAVEHLHSLGVRGVVSTLGPEGARYDGDGAACSARYHKTAQVTDTTGAGDCLAGWFIARRLAGDSLGEALSAAVYAATYSCGGIGAQSSYPTAAQLRQFRLARA